MSRHGNLFLAALNFGFCLLNMYCAVVLSAAFSAVVAAINLATAVYFGALYVSAEINRG